MTTTVIVKAHCGTDKEVLVNICSDTRKHGTWTTLQEGEEKTFHIWDNQILTTSEILKENK
jgi:hypothetical protein